MIQRVAVRPAGAAGRVARWALALASLLLSLAGPALVVYGLYQIWSPLGWIAAGGFLLWLDRVWSK